MGTPFPVEARSAEFLAAARGWTCSALDDLGVEVLGPSEQVRVQPWSTQLVTPTTAGRVWFKANALGSTHEAALHAALSRLATGFVDAPLAIDARRGWLLTRDRGLTLAERGETSLLQWCALIQEAGRLQRHVAGLPLVRDTGVPDCTPPSVLGRFDTLLDRFAALPASDPCHLDGEELTSFQRVRPRLEQAVAVLTAGSLPSTLNHGDLHPGNVFVDRGHLRLFDFADAQWAAAPEILGAAWGWLVYRTSHPWRRVFDAYREVWSDLVTASEFDQLVTAAMDTLPVNRSMMWTYATAGVTEDTFAEWADAPISQLRHVREPWPP